MYLATFGDWATWSAWSDCTESCGGGTQSRTRECVTQDGDEDCIGDGQQNRVCNDVECPGLQFKHEFTV